jgi:hypothetical protein
MEAEEVALIVAEVVLQQEITVALVEVVQTMQQLEEQQLLQVRVITVVKVEQG